MSTYFDIGCYTCGGRADIENMRSEKSLRLLVQHRAVLETLVQETGYAQLKAGSSDAIDLDFFVEHAGHRLVVMSEYETLVEAVSRVEKGLSWAEFSRLQNLPAAPTLPDCSACDNVRWFDDRGFIDRGQPAFEFVPCSDCNADGAYTRAHLARDKSAKNRT